MNFKLKIFVAGICILALIWLSLHSYLNFDKYDPSIKQFLGNPDKYEGKVASHKGNIIYEDDKMYIKSGDEVILIKYNEKIPKAKFGYTLLKGVYRIQKTEEPNKEDYLKNGNGYSQEYYIEVSEYWNNDYNYVKYIISFFALIYVIILFFKEWKVTIKGFVAREL